VGSDNRKFLTSCQLKTGLINRSKLHSINTEPDNRAMFSLA
jgi:hypothetical protein